ncbi:hypothetical protein [Bathymodiolus heckerae thiotrophic gill symbiont]|uniref:hypothetical protein n=1 Tax=Bathymodiolus heckerae thiotrophic gill symbiont TaxID=1052212 RepID=UPI0010FDEB7E|nr:hypothetical protein [Bathymodiolus heckerae thiotrophic gill symbiont]
MSKKIYRQQENFIKNAKKNNYNALINYKTEFFGFGSTFQGKTINGAKGSGVYILRTTANPVEVRCNK